MKKTMKKLLTTMFIAIVAILMLETVSNATTKSELKDYILSEKTIGGSTWVISNQDKAKVEKFFKDNEITDAQATKIKEVGDKAIAYMNKIGASEPEKIKTKEQKQQLLAYAQEAASTLGLTTCYNTSTQRLDVYKNGTKIDSLRWGVKKVTDSKTGKKKNVITTEPSAIKTGSTNYIYVIAGGLVLIAGTTLVIARKKNASLNA